MHPNYLLVPVFIFCYESVIMHAGSTSLSGQFNYLMKRQCVSYQQNESIPANIFLSFLYNKLLRMGAPSSALGSRASALC